MALSKITNASLSTGISADKLGDGSVTSTEFQYINTLSSNAQTQIAGAGGANVYKGYFTRNTATATGTVAYTGVGFTVKAVIFFSCIGGTDQVSWGLDDGTLKGAIYDNNSSGATRSETTSFSIWPRQQSGDYADGYISALGADGFSINWVKVGSPSGTAQIHYLAIG